MIFATQNDKDSMIQCLRQIGTIFGIRSLSFFVVLLLLLILLLLLPCLFQMYQQGGYVQKKQMSYYSSQPDVDEESYGLYSLKDISFEDNCRHILKGFDCM